MTSVGDDSVAVIGLGRFGGQVAASLERLGHEVLAIDNNPALVQKWADKLTHVVEADATDEEALRQLGLADFPRVVVGIGTGIEASVLTVIGLVDLGVREIWAKAITAQHGQILQRIGAHHVVYPEAAMGERVAHLVTGKMIDFIEFDDGFAIVKMYPPKPIRGLSLAESHVRQRYGITVVGVKSPGKDFTYATAETVISNHDLIIASGSTSDLEKFAALQ